MNNRGIRNGHVEIHVTKSGGFKAYVIGTHPDFIRAWQGWSGMCRHTPKGQPSKGFEKIMEAVEFCKVLFPSAAVFEKYVRTAPSTKMSNAAADVFCETDVLTVYPNALVPSVRRHEIVERINAILQDGGEGMHSSDVLDCVCGSVGFEMFEAEKKFCVREVRSITGNP